jgi:exonuclease III
VYIQDQYDVTFFNHMSTDGTEAVSIFLPAINLIIITIYRPPDASLDDFQQCLSWIRLETKHIEDLSNDHPNMIINGDINLPKSWSLEDV